MPRVKNNRIRRLAKKLLGGAFYHLGLFHLVRFYNNIAGRRLTILTYHRVTDRDVRGVEGALPYLLVNNRTFDAHLRFLKKYYNTVSFGELEDMAGDGRKIPWNTLIITFDDGYLDFYEHAYPLMKEHSVPSTVFLAVDRIGDDDARPFWWDNAYFYFTRLAELRKNGGLRNPDGMLRDLLDNFESDPSATFEQMNRMKTEDIEEFLDRIRADHGLPAESQYDNRMLDWGKVRKMNDMVEVGSHTLSHINLNRLTDELKAIEIRDSRTTIRKMTGKSAKVFSYPAGNYDDVSKKLVRDSGYSFAVTTDRGVEDGRDPYTLKRMNVWEGTSESTDGSFSKGLFSLRLVL